MDILKTVDDFYESYKGQKEILGRTVCGNAIYAFYIGEKGAGTRILSQSAMHAREWITAALALEQIKKGLKNGYAVVVPIANPDGVALATRGKAFLKTLPMEKQKFLLKVNGGHTDFSLWKANANAVDINVNFDADWGQGASNVRQPSTESYIGEKPNSEIETQILIALTERFLPQVTLNYHSKGEEIYWYYRQQGADYGRAEAFATYMAKCTGYTAKKIFGSTGGYKDWCILKKKLLALTIEVGQDEWQHPLTEKYLPQLVQKNGTALQDTVNFLNTSV